MPFMAKYDPFSPTLDHPLLNSSPDFTNPSSRNGSLRARVLGNGTFNSGAFSGQMSFRERSKRIRDIEDEKQQLIDELIYNLESCESQLQQLRLDRDRDAQYNQNVQLRESTLQEQLQRTKEIMDRNAFIFTLIDGDSMPIFKNLIPKGEQGGQEAAEMLSTALIDYARENFSHLDRPRLVARIYTTSRGLSRDKIDDHGVFTEFTRGFNSFKAHFDFVDAGRGDSTFKKVSETLQLLVRDCHCHQVIFGWCSSGSYNQVLAEIAQNAELRSHLTVLDCEACGNEETTGILSQFKCTKLNSIFGGSVADTPAIVLKAPAPLIPAAPALAKIGSNTKSGTASPSATPQPKWAAIAASAQSQVPPPPPVLAKPEAAKPLRTPTPGSTQSTEANQARTSGKTIDRNRMGQRVDKADTTIPNYEIQRVKKLKLCNIFHLQSPKECTASHCSHRHDYPISNYERRVLREVARMTPCYYKFDCDDPDCIYGHRCPQSKPNEQGCYYGEDCRFYGWGHGIDTRVVKTTKV